ncbi:hypothetical protein ACLBWX_22480 [Methylobacterium sp. M6A4_1b]
MSDELKPVTVWTPGQGDPVPRHKRNPRRAYDPQGRESAPMTIANARENGARGLLVLCRCEHEAAIPFGDLPGTAFVPDIALRLRCTACGGGAKGVETRPDFTGRRFGGTSGT